MAEFNSRPDHIEDVLIKYRAGPWFSWTTSKNKIYSNLILAPKVQDPADHHKLIDNPHSIPTEQELTDKLTELQAEYDAQDYARKRQAAYPPTADFMEAYTEKEIGGNSTKWDAYVINYNKVRTENPK